MDPILNLNGQNQKKKRDLGNAGAAMNLLFTMLLFLTFVLCALFVVLIGGRVYENINRRSNENYTGSVALQYVANKVRQNDTAGGIRVEDHEGVPVLELDSVLGDITYETWIYYYDGSIRELFSDPADGLGLDAGLEILPCEGFTVSQSQDQRTIQIHTDGAGGGSLTLAVRSQAGGSYESE